MADDRDRDGTGATPAAPQALGPRGGLGEDGSGCGRLPCSSPAALKPRPAQTAGVCGHHFAFVAGTWEDGLEVTATASAPLGSEARAPPAWCLVLCDKQDKIQKTLIKMKEQTPEATRRARCAGLSLRRHQTAQRDRGGRGGTGPPVAGWEALICFHY
ncbi:dynein regulatory complex protein 8 isoform X2 [Budorcas taxicolor]|uniref:dynein regulatory complex protein 8 isoform X2 n=1 Tax=Budorcas taxicolor TaxID=37181 RepID=UPI002284F265|nr:dynein regulatory complex protein 8 isoform X2 [Budorcas taxicolor]